MFTPGIPGGLPNKATFTDGVADFSITAPTTATWMVQMTHPVALTAGMTYTICYSTKADQDRSIAVDINRGGTPDYTSLTGRNNTAESVFTTWANHKFTFVATVTDDTARIDFNLGMAANPVSVKLDNIGVYVGSNCPSVNPNPGSSSSSTSVSSGSSSSGGGAAKSSSSSSSSTGGGGGGTVLFSENFEMGTNGAAPTGWSTVLPGGTSATIDNTKAHTGTNSVHLKVSSSNAAATRIFRRLPGGISKIYARAWIYSSASIGGNPADFRDHGDFMGTSREASVSGNLELRFGPVVTGRLAGFQHTPQDGPTKASVGDSTQKIPANTWTCVEISVQPAVETFQGWVNDNLTFSANKPADWDNGNIADTITPDDLRSVYFGWRGYGTGLVRPTEVWFDDIAYSETKIGCN